VQGVPRVATLTHTRYRDESSADGEIFAQPVSRGSSRGLTTGADVYEPKADGGASVQSLSTGSNRDGVTPFNKPFLGTKKPAFGFKSGRFNVEKTADLFRGVAKHGTKWVVISEDPEFYLTLFGRRTASQLKEKFNKNSNPATMHVSLLPLYSKSSNEFELAELLYCCWLSHMIFNAIAFPGAAKARQLEDQMKNGRTSTAASLSRRKGNRIYCIAKYNGSKCGKCGSHIVVGAKIYKCPRRKINIPITGTPTTPTVPPQPSVTHPCCNVPVLDVLLCLPKQLAVTVDNINFRPAAHATLLFKISV
jgi:hypothetical protein